MHALPRADDVVIRSYDKCPALTAANRQLFASAAWRQKEAEHRPLLQAIATNVAPLYPKVFSEHTAWADSTDGVPLKDLWNVFDALSRRGGAQEAGLYSG